LLNLSRNQLQIMTGLLRGHYHLKGQLFKLGLVNSPECNICQQAPQNSLIEGAAFNVTHFESRITHLLYTAINTTEHG